MPLDKVFYVKRQDFNSPVESIKQQTDPYRRATKRLNLEAIWGELTADFLRLKYKNSARASNQH